jgi:hypothetical protein
MALDSQPMTEAGAQSDVKAPSGEVRRFARQAVWFVVFGLLIYAGLYAASEHLVYKYAQANRFYKVKTAPYQHFDYVILGASHSAAFDLEDMNARLEEITKSKILNLSTTGGGVTINRLLLEYFLVRHQTSTVVYVVDSFIFDSRQWNEDRLQDARLFYRAPLDLSLVRLMMREHVDRSVVLNYASGFSKINNPDRFAPDVPDDTARFEKTYRPVKQIDQQRIDYLFPRQNDDQATELHYMAEFETLIQNMKARNIRVIVIKPPIPERFYRMLPNESRFDTNLKGILDRDGVEFDDFSHVSNDESFFFNSDHLNRTGVLNFFQNYLAGKLTSDTEGK